MKYPTIKNLFIHIGGSSFVQPASGGGTVKTKYAKVRVIRDEPTASPYYKDGADKKGRPLLYHPPMDKRPLIKRGNTLIVNLSHIESDWDKQTGVEGGIWSATLGKNKPVYIISTGSGLIQGQAKDTSVAGWFIRVDHVEIIETFERGGPEPVVVDQPEEEKEKMKYARVKVSRDEPTASPYYKDGEDKKGRPILHHPHMDKRPLIARGNILIVNLSHKESDWDEKTGVEGGIWSATLGDKYPVYIISTGSGLIQGQAKDTSVAGWYIRVDQVEVIETFEQ